MTQPDRRIFPSEPLLNKEGASLPQTNLYERAGQSLDEIPSDEYPPSFVHRSTPAAPPYEFIPTTGHACELPPKRCKWEVCANAGTAAVRSSDE